ncbi:MAG: hypothetical protein ACRCXT_02120 [Paraclostridium sp.]
MSLCTPQTLLYNNRGVNENYTEVDISINIGFDVNINIPLGGNTIINNYYEEPVQDTRRVIKLYEKVAY